MKRKGSRKEPQRAAKGNAYNCNFASLCAKALRLSAVKSPSVTDAYTQVADTITGITDESKGVKFKVPKSQILKSPNPHIIALSHQHISTLKERP